jgi:hypothetical protein
VTRAEREEKVLETVREWLPRLERPGSVIQISLADPDDPAVPEGALFTVETTHAFVCRRGS